MSELVLHAEIREITGKEYAKKLRQQGKIPGIFYAQDEAAIPITLDAQNATKVLTSKGGLIEIQIGSKKKRKAIIKEVQTDPVRQSLVHVDVMGVQLKVKITIEVPIHFLGEAIGVKEQGGILHQYFREIEVNCLPLDIPDHIDIDVSNLKLGDSIAIRDLSIPNVEILGDPQQHVVSVMAPTVVKEKVAEETPEAAEAAEAAEKEAAATAQKE
ncbi:MAG: 50S ribosomal protein L25 [bacterium]|jgi:large subunit ribosomal protein L25|nr:50S ribosomal protein L25 [bacterium]